MPADAQFTPGRKYTSAVSRGTNQFSVLLNFAETYPYDPARPEQLTGIFYTPVTPTEAGITTPTWHAETLFAWEPGDLRPMLLHPLPEPHPACPSVFPSAPPLRSLFDNTMAGTP